MGEHYDKMNSAMRDVLDNMFRPDQEKQIMLQQ